MPGHMGTEQVTIQNLEIVSIDTENNVILVKGNVPGPKKSLVLVKSSIKHPGKINTPVELITYVDETVAEPTEVEETAEVTEAPVEEVTAEETNEESSQDEKVAE